MRWRALEKKALIYFLAVMGIFSQTASAEETPSKAFSIIPGMSVHGEYSLKGAMHRTGGSGDKTLLRRGEFLTNALKLQAEQILGLGWNARTDLHVRKTQDPQIDKRKDLHMLGLTIEIYNPKFRFTFGDIFGDFSQYTLGQSLEGFQAALDTDRLDVKAVAGHSQREDEGRQFKRYVFGGRSEVLAVKEYGPLSDARLGLNFSEAEDDRGSIENKGTAADASNRVGSFTHHAIFWEKSVWDMEAAKSWIDEDARSGPVLRRAGTALRILNNTKLTKKAKTKLTYEWVGADFNTLTGSAIPDRVNMLGRVNYRFNEAWMSDAAYRANYNKLDKSTADKRTVLHVPNMALTWTPNSSDWKLQDFFSRLYWEMRRRYSQDDATGQVDFQADEIGLEDEFKVRKYNLSSGWSIRKEDDDFQKINDRLTNTGFIGVRTYRHFWRADVVPSGRWMILYDHKPKEEGRDLRHVMMTGLDMDFSGRVRFEQRYSLETNSRLLHDSDSIRFNAYAGVDYKIHGLQGTTLKISYEHIGFAHDVGIERFSEHNLQAEILQKF